MFIAISVFTWNIDEKEYQFQPYKHLFKKKGFHFLYTCLNKKSFDPYGFCSTNVIPCILLIKK